MDIVVSEEIKKACPRFSGIAVSAFVKNTERNDALWERMTTFAKEYGATHSTEDIKKNEAIAATRAAYKALGKDPNRYRPSSEALCRRIVRGLPLYRVNTVVDLLNFVSLRTGYSIGGFDADKISGDTLTLGVGATGEPYEGIGRGTLNIEHMPVYRDAAGGIGTPTSDNERTKLDVSSCRLLAIVNGYDGGMHFPEAVRSIEELLREFADCRSVEIRRF